MSGIKHMIISKTGDIAIKDKYSDGYFYKGLFFSDKELVKSYLEREPIFLLIRDDDINCTPAVKQLKYAVMMSNIIQEVS